MEVSPQTCVNCGEVITPRGAPKFCGNCGATLPKKSDGANLRILTLMFVDLVGSTAKASISDLEEHDRWLTSFHEVAETTLRNYEGVTLQHYGDGLLVCFGLTQDSENAATAAILAAIALRKSVATVLNNTELRIGIHSGEVFCKLGVGGHLQPSVTGFDVNLTARIQSSGGPNDIVISQVTRHFTARTAVINCVDMGPTNLKGVPEPTQLYKVQNCKIRRTFDKIPELLERQFVVDKLCGITESSPIIITGPAGIGKSSVLTQACAELAKNSEIIAISARANIRYSPLFPIAQWLSELLGYPSFPIEQADLDGDPLADLNERLKQVFGLDAVFDLSAIADALTLPNVSQLVQKSAPGQLRLARIHAFVQIIHKLAAARKITVVFDDLQWADSDSLEAVIEVLNTGKRGCRIVLAARSTPEMNAFIRNNQLHEIPLLPLSADAAQKMLGGEAFSTITARKREKAISRAEGNPLFLKALASALQGAAARSSETLPLTIEATFQSMINTLDEGKETILMASILGRKFSGRHLRWLLGGDHALSECLLALEDRGLVKLESNSISFSHILLRDAAYSMLPKSRKRSLHRTFAKALQENDPRLCADFPEILAEHALASRDRRLIVQSCIAAGQIFLRRAVFDSAVTFLSKAEEHLSRLIETSNSESDAEVFADYINVLSLLASAQVQRFGFSHPLVEQSYLKLEAAVLKYPKNGLAAMQAQYGLFAYHMTRGRVRICKQYERKMAANVDPNDGKQQLLHLVNQSASALYSGRLPQVLTTNTHIRNLYKSDQHGTLFVEIGADPLISALTAEIHVYAYQGRLKQAQRTFHDALEHAELIGANLQKPWIMIFGAAALFYGGDQMAARANVAQGIVLADKQGAAFWSLVGRIWNAVFQIEIDADPQIIAELESMIPQLDNLGTHLARPLFMAVLGSAYSKGENWSKSEELLATAARRVAFHGEGIWGAEIWDKRLLSALRRGDKEYAGKAQRISDAYAKRADADLWIKRADQRQLMIRG